MAAGSECDYTELQLSGAQNAVAWHSDQAFRADHAWQWHAQHKHGPHVQHAQHAQRACFQHQQAMAMAQQAADIYAQKLQRLQTALPPAGDARTLLENRHTLAD